MRLKLLIAYRGTHYHGWQQQPVLPTYKGVRPRGNAGIPTIQETIAGVVSKVVGHPIVVVASSRTDAGVHAKGQVAHMDVHLGGIPMDGLRRATNHRLPEDILIREMEPVEDSFDAIAAAKEKRYQYFIWNDLNRNPFFPDLCWHRWMPLDVEAMQEAGAHFVGEQDFTSFARPRHGRDSSVRTVLECSVAKRGPRIVIGVGGKGFLWNQIRIMAGTLVQVGIGQYKPEDIPKMLAARDRRAGGSTAPAQGLWLQWIKTQSDK